jgi:hypothetical protein
VSLEPVDGSRATVFIQATRRSGSTVRDSIIADANPRRRRPSCNTFRFKALTLTRSSTGASPATRRHDEEPV